MDWHSFTCHKNEPSYKSWLSIDDDVKRMQDKTSQEASKNKLYMQNNAAFPHKRKKEKKKQKKKRKIRWKSLQKLMVFSLKVYPDGEANRQTPVMDLINL